MRRTRITSKLLSTLVPLIKRRQEEGGQFNSVNETMRTVLCGCSGNLMGCGITTRSDSPTCSSCKENSIIFEFRCVKLSFFRQLQFSLTNSTKQFETAVHRGTCQLGACLTTLFLWKGAYYYFRRTRAHKQNRSVKKYVEENSRKKRTNLKIEKSTWKPKSEHEKQA